MLGIRTQGDLQHLSACGDGGEGGKIFRPAYFGVESVLPLSESGCSLGLNVVEHEVHI